MKKLLLISFWLVLTLNLCLFSTVKSDNSANSMFSLLTKARADIEIPGVTVCSSKHWTYPYKAGQPDYKECKYIQLDCNITSTCS
jgi:hypothetical protein